MQNPVNGWIKFAMAAATLLVAAVLAFGAVRDEAGHANTRSQENAAAISALSERLARIEERARAIKESLDRIEAAVLKLGK